MEKNLGGMEKEYSQPWDILLRNCEFDQAAEDIRNALRLMDEEAGSKGGQAYYKEEFVAVLKAFLLVPSIETAIPLLEVAPFLFATFDRCSPGGAAYEMRHLLDDNV